MDESPFADLWFKHGLGGFPVNFLEESCELVPLDVVEYLDQEVDATGDRSIIFGDNPNVKTMVSIMMGCDHSFTRREVERRKRAFSDALEAGDPRAKEIDLRYGQVVLTVSRLMFFQFYLIDEHPIELDSAGNPLRDERGKLIGRKIPEYLRGSIQRLENKRDDLMSDLKDIAEKVSCEILMFATESRACPECGTVFTPKRIGQIYDKRSCAARAGERRRYQERKNLASSA